MSADSPIHTRRGRIATAIIGWVGLHIGGKAYDDRLGAVIRRGTRAEVEDRTVQFKDLTDL